MPDASEESYMHKVDSSPRTIVVRQAVNFL